MWVGGVRGRWLWGAQAAGGVLAGGGGVLAVDADRRLRGFGEGVARREGRRRGRTRGASPQRLSRL